MHPRPNQSPWQRVVTQRRAKVAATLCATQLTIPAIDDQRNCKHRLPHHPHPRGAFAFGKPECGFVGGEDDRVGHEKRPDCLPVAGLRSASKRGVCPLCSVVWRAPAGSRAYSISHPRNVARNNTAYSTAARAVTPVWKVFRLLSPLV